MFRFFKRKQEKKAADNFALLANMLKEKQAASISEPWTLAKARLEGGAKDAGAGKGLRMYNAHLSRLQNQWINPLQSVNSGYGTAHASLFLYQPVNYYECYSLAQDPLFAKVFNVLSETPFAKGGELSNLSAEEKDRAEEAASRFDLWQHLRAAVRSNYVTGGCLLYMDFGLSGRELEEPLDLNRMDMKRFRGFRHIDPINCVAVQVNTVNPAAGDYMQPSIWYVIGLGTVHKSHFLKFEANIPELPMRPLTLYFGMPLTQLIKQDVANSNLASQGLANLMNRFRFTYLKADESSFTTENAKCFKDRLNFMSFVQDNFGVCPIKTTEDVMQLTTSLAGMAENVEEFYLLISAKTDIPYTELMGKSAEGMNATGSGDRRKWYDKCRSIQESVKNNLLFMYGIVAGVDSGKFVKFTDFTFNPLEEATEKELAENIKSYAEVASALVNLGAKQDEVFEWLKQFKQFNLDGLSFDTETEGLGGYEDITPQVMSEFQAANEWREEDHPRGKDGKFGQGGGDDEEVSFEEQLSQIIEKAKNAPNERQIITLGKASDRLVKEAEKKGFNISDFIHNLDVSGVRHAFLEHGNEKTESKRGQTAISYDDLKKVPEIISDYDNVEFPGKNKIGRDVIKYTKKFSDGTVYYVEEIRNGRRTLTIQTMYKSKSR
nr:MAG TPA: portal [Caudoviricetes sp.]